MRLLLILGLLALVGCKPKNESISVGMLVKHKIFTDNKECLVSRAIDQRNDILIKCSANDVGTWVNSMEYVEVKTKTTKKAAKSEIGFDSSVIPKSLIQVKCVKGKDVVNLQGLEFHTSLNGSFVDRGYVCTYKKVSLKYE